MPIDKKFGIGVGYFYHCSSLLLKLLELNPCLLAKYLRIYNLWGISANIYEKNVDSSLLILSQTLQRMHNYQTKNSNRNFLRIVMALNNYGILGLKHTPRKSIHNCISKLHILGEKIDLLLFTINHMYSTYVCSLKIIARYSIS